MKAENRGENNQKGPESKTDLVALTGSDFLTCGKIKKTFQEEDNNFKECDIENKRALL